MNRFLQAYKYFLVCVLILNLTSLHQAKAQPSNHLVQLEGKTTDSITHEPLTGVTVMVTGGRYATTSDANGYFRINVPTGKRRITFSIIGYTPKQIDTNIVAKVFLETELAPEIQKMDEVTITTRNARTQVEGVNTGTFLLSRKEIGSIPLLLGETDYFKAIQLMPGVQTTGEGNAAIYVRGGAYDQNLVLLNEATVYNPTHLLGFYSVFNSDVISSVKVIKSGMPAEYGNRLSSVIEFTGKQDIPDHTSVSGNLGLLSSRLCFETPLANRRISLSLAARKTYLNMWLDLMRNNGLIKNKSILHKSGYDFYDLNGTINAVINSKNRISLSLYKGEDIFKLNAWGMDLDAHMQWGNSIGALTWRKIFSDNVYMENTLVYSGYKLDMDLDQSQYSFNTNSQIQDFGFRNKITWLWSKHKISTGLSATYHNIIPNKSRAASDSSQLNLGSVNNYYSVEGSIFLSDEIKINDRISGIVGLRLNTFSHLGNFKTYTRDEYGNITDTLSYKRWDPIKNYTNMDIRASIRYLLRENLSVKLSFNTNSQYLHLVNASSVTFPTDFWVSSSDKVKPQTGKQWAAGLFHLNKRFNIEASVEFYYKTLSNQIEFYKGFLNSIDNSAFDDNLIYGKGRAYGAEFLIRKNEGKITGWIGYTLSKTEKSFTAIEEGRWYPAKYDRPNDLSVVLNYNTNKKWSFSAVFVYASGSTYTPVVGRYIVSGNVVNEYGQYNAARMPTYHRCDVSATLLLKKTERTESKLIFSVYNVYNRRNPFFIYPETTGNLSNYSLKVSPKEISIFPVLPSIGWEFHF